MEDTLRGSEEQSFALCRDAEELGLQKSRSLLALMILAREWDVRFETLLKTGDVSKWYSAVGNEATTVGAASALTPGDALLTLHRDVGALFAHYLNPHELFPQFCDLPREGSWQAGSRDYLFRLASQMFATSEGFTQGFERSFHFGCIEPGQKHYHIGMISHLGSMIPVSAGVAWANQQKANGRVALNFIGEGGTSNGDFHEGLNFASVWKLPLILIVENNRYAFSTKQSEQFACQQVSDRGVGYGIPGISVDGTRVQQVQHAVTLACERARRGEGPTLIEAHLPRLRGHSEQDRSLNVVPPHERRKDQQNDPVDSFSKACLQVGFINQEDLQGLQSQARQLMIEITDAAKSHPDLDPEAAISARKVVLEAPPIVEAEVEESSTVSPDTPSVTYLQAIQQALDTELGSDTSVVLIGQDIAEFGGAFKVTEGLLNKYGPQRVRNTPISESGALGLAIGSSLLGFRPVVEMQFADFISCAFNQIVNVAAKMFYRWRQNVPIVIRCPYGGGAGAGAFHSQCPEAWFTHVPGLKVACPSRPSDASGLLREAIRDPNPVLFFEHKYLYRRTKQKFANHSQHRVPLGKARLVCQGSDLTVIAYGWMVEIAARAAEVLSHEGHSVEVIDLRTLIPLDLETILSSVKKTSRVTILHEATLTGGFGGEIAALIADQAFDFLDAPIKRIAYPDTPVPYHKELEQASLPNVAKVVDALKEQLKY